MWNVHVKSYHNSSLNTQFAAPISGIDVQTTQRGQRHYILVQKR
jgi:hypothetical protein